MTRCVILQRETCVCKAQLNLCAIFRISVFFRENDTHQYSLVQKVLEVSGTFFQKVPESVLLFLLLDLAGGAEREL